MNEEAALVGLMRMWGWIVIVPRNGATHGELRTYRQGCKCAPCRRAMADKQRAYRRKKGVKPKQRRKFQILDFDDPIYQLSPNERRAVVGEGVKVDFTKSGKPVIHGRRVSYQRHGCRCLECRLANSAATREWRERQKGAGTRKRRPYTPPKHGTTRGYNLGCCCDPCMQANREAKLAGYHLYKDGLTLSSDLDEYIFG